MDWGAVTPAELLASLREADWRRAAARSWLEVLGRMNIPRNQARWQARLKANTYYYRVNYAHVAAALVALSLLRRPAALALAAVAAAGGVVAASPAAAAALGDAALAAARRVHPPLARALKAGGGGGLGPPGAPPRAAGRALGAPRLVAASALLLLGLGGLLRAGVASRLFAVAVLAAILAFGHASLRSPNLKARPASARADFNASWRSEAAEAGGGARPPGGERDYAL
jgi:hypothetical protein